MHEIHLMEELETTCCVGQPRNTELVLGRQNPVECEGVGTVQAPMTILRSNGFLRGRLDKKTVTFVVLPLPSPGGNLK